VEARGQGLGVGDQVLGVGDKVEEYPLLWNED
jgi:hypothetical protein